MPKKRNKPKQKKATKLEESVHILNMIMFSLQSELECLKSIATVEFSGNQLFSINQLTFKHGLIQVQSFMDEFEKHFLNNINTQQVNAINPYYKRIKKELERFPHIKKYRNNVLAHNYRTDNKNSVFLHGNFRTYSVPQNLKEYMFLIECISALNKIVNQLLPDAHNNAVEVILEKNTRDITPFKRMLSDNELQDAMALLQKDLDLISSQNLS